MRRRRARRRCSRDPEYGARQHAFRARLADSGVTAATVTTPGELEAAVLHALVELPREQAATAAEPVAGPVWSVPPLRGDEVARPELAEALVAAVLAPDASAVGVTTGLVGAGGFGKTTLARMVAHDPRVRAEFAGGVVWVTVGEDAGGPGPGGQAGVGGAVVRPGRGGGDRPAGGRGGVGAGAGGSAGAAGGRRCVVDRAGGAVPHRRRRVRCGCSPPASRGCCPTGWPGCGWIR